MPDRGSGFHASRIGVSNARAPISSAIILFKLCISDFPQFRHIMPTVLLCSHGAGCAPLS
jgi:hypothetical protein